MPFKKIGSPDPKYLAATDILISDMSNINYDFLLFNRPIILLSNKWLRENFPDLGIKTDLDGMEDAIKRSIDYPEEFEKNRKHWHKKTMHKPDGKSSERVVDSIIKYSGTKDPLVFLIYGKNPVLKVHLDPIYEVLKKRGIRAVFIDFFKEDEAIDKNTVFISTHNELLQNIPFGYRVHIDHSVKGIGVTDFEKQVKQIKEMDYFPNTDLHITEGEVSFEKTKKWLGPYRNRAVMVGYPKSDVLLRFDTMANKESVYKELGFKPGKILITYAPTGKYRYPFKQGASLSNKVLKRLNQISNRNDYNILVKLRSTKPFTEKVYEKIKIVFNKK